MTHGYTPEDRLSSPRDVIAAWTLAIFIVAVVAAFGPQANVDTEYLSGTPEVVSTL